MKQDFLFSFFKEIHKPAVKKVNDFYLVLRKTNNHWAVSVFSEISYLRAKEHLPELVEEDEKPKYGKYGEYGVLDIEQRRCSHCSCSHKIVCCVCGETRREVN